mmetsp:Transcript_35236/g.64391  ORF Transcript_35236/g.64391 Transcript_35236/m.64391 type:complete len:716 (-) Transcript_35236:100-2247(-)
MIHGPEWGSKGALLHQAILENAQQTIEFYLEQGADVNYYDSRSAVPLATPLRAACKQAKLKLVQSLVEKQASVFAHFEVDSWSALHSAADGGHGKVWKLLLEEAEELHDTSLHNGFPLIHIVVECANPRLHEGGVDLVNHVIRRHFPHVDINARSERPGFQGWTALHLAASRGGSKLTHTLLRHKAEVQARTGSFHIRSAKINSYLIGGSKGGLQPAPVDSLSEQAPDTWLDSGLLPIHVAALGGHLGLVQTLARSSPVDGLNAVTSKHQWTPLMFAVWNGDVAIVEELLRIGARTVVNCKDRGQAEELVPLAIAVAKGSIDMVNALVAYSADPLVRLRSNDFPGRIFLDNVSPLLPDSHQNSWSGPDTRISLLHIAVVRGYKEMIRHVAFLMRAAHLNPVRMASHSPELLRWQECSERSAAAGSAYRERLQQGSSPWTCKQTGGEGRNRCRRSAQHNMLAATKKPAPTDTFQALLRPHSEVLVPKQIAKRFADEPVFEGPSRDPVRFTTTEGWSAAVLAVILHTVDHNRAVPMPLLLELSDPTQESNDRGEAFLELLSAGAAFYSEDEPEEPPPSVPQRFADVSEVLILRAIDELIRLCRFASREQEAARVLHSSLCAAAEFDKRKVAHFLLEECGCDPRCNFIQQVERRPLHLAGLNGNAYIAQMLLEHKADAAEKDRDGEKPIDKLARNHEAQLSELKAKVRALEDQLSSQQ